MQSNIENDLDEVPYTVCRSSIWDKSSIELRESIQPSHNMIIHGQAAGFACVFTVLSSV